MIIKKRLTELNIELPVVAVPVANYISYNFSGNQVHISGQLPKLGDDMIIGKVGDNLTKEDGIKAAELCMLNIISQLNSACEGNLDKVKRAIKINVFVNSSNDFTDHPIVANGASDLLVNVFGEKGKHARSAVGVSSLPRGVAVEIDAIFEIDR